MCKTSDSTARAHCRIFRRRRLESVHRGLTLNIGTRYTLNFPSTEVHDQGAVFNLQTQVLEFPHTARKLECCDFGPRLGLAYRIGDSWVIRSGYGMVYFSSSPASQRRLRFRNFHSFRPWVSKLRIM